MDQPRTEEMRALASLFEEFDHEVDAFTAVASLACPTGCGDCCDHADTEVTITEARLIAHHIRAELPELETHLERINADPDRVACVFYNPDRDFHCRIYAVRPLICRAFGYSAYSDRTGNKLFAICPSMPIAQKSGGAMQVLFEPYPPVVEQYAARIKNIAETFTKNGGKRPLAQAVQKALQAYHDEHHENDENGSSANEEIDEVAR